MADTKYNLKRIEAMLEELPEEERERFIMDKLKLMTDLPRHNAQKIDTKYLYEISDEIEERYKVFGKFQGIPSGYAFIDQHMTKGFVGGEMIILAGATSNGKTATAINMAHRIAKSGHKVLFVTLEMTPTELGSRFQKVGGGIPMGESMLPIMYQVNDHFDWKDVDPLIEKAKREGAEVVFIDHLHYFVRETENHNEILGMISKEIKKNAIRHNIPIILLAQLRKGSNTKTLNELDIEDISGSFAVAQDADIVIMVQRIFDEESDSDLIGVVLRKNRNRGHDPRDDKRLMDFKETVILDPEYDIQLRDRALDRIPDENYRNYYEKDNIDEESLHIPE